MSAPRPPADPPDAPETWEGCRVEVLSEAGHALFRDDDCDVRLGEDGLVISYWDERGAVVFSGRRASDGRFDLWCRSRPARAVLRRSAGGGAFEGSWSEGERRGTWRIERAPG